MHRMHPQLLLPAACVALLEHEYQGKCMLHVLLVYHAAPGSMAFFASLGSRLVLVHSRGPCEQTVDVALAIWTRAYMAWLNAGITGIVTM